MKYFFYSLVFLIISCATPGPLSGGEQDTTPPKVVKTFPDTLSINSNPSKIIIYFDEYIVDNNLDQNIIFSPNPPCEPEYKIVKSKQLHIKIPCSLDSNTTYSINLINAIKDNNEGNLLPFYSFTFSTGSYIDTNFITGIVKNPYTNEVIDKAIVALYDTTISDSFPIENKPKYLTKTAEDGTFTIPYLPIANYTLLSFKDENKNLLVNNEELASVYYRVNSSDTLPQEILISPFLMKKKLDIQCIGDDYKQTLVFNQEMEEPFQLLYNAEYLNFTSNLTKDSFTFFLPINLPADEIFFIQDTLKKPVKINKIKKKLNGITSIVSIDTLNTIITFENPIQVYDTSGLTLKVDDSTFVDFNLIKLDTFSFQLITQKSMPYILDIDTLFTRDIYNRINPKKNITLTAPPPNETELIIEIKVLDSIPNQHIIEFFKDDKIIYSLIVKNDTTLTLEHLKAGSYNIRYYIDIDQNKRFTPANFLINRKAEPVVHLSPIELRSNWKSEFTIDIRY